MSAMFPDRQSAEMGMAALFERGYDSGDVELWMSDYARQRYFACTLPTTTLGRMAAAANDPTMAELREQDLPPSHIHRYVAALRSGAIVMLVRPRTDQDARYLDNMWRIGRAQVLYG